MKLSATKLEGEKKATDKAAVRIADLKAQIAALEQGAVAELTGRRKVLHAELAAVDAEISRLTGATFENAALEREMAEARAANEALTRQRDELARRIARVTGEQKRLLDDLAEPSPADAGQRSGQSAAGPLKSDSPDRGSYTTRAAVTGKTPDLKKSKQIIPEDRKDRKEQGNRPDFDSPEFFMALTGHFYAAKRAALGLE